MLVLGRKIGQIIQIYDNITITVLSSSREKVRLGIVAPREVPIYRSELLLEDGSAPPYPVDNPPKS